VAVRRGSDERALLWTVLLPATSRRTVLLGLPAGVRDGLLRRYPDAVVDGDAGGADLVVCTSAARPASVPPGAALAVLGGPRTPASAALLGTLDEPAGLLLPGQRAPGRSVPLTVRTSAPSLADAVLAAYAPGSTLLEVLGGACAVLRVASPGGEVAIRLALTPESDRGGAESLRAVAAAAGSPPAWLPRELGAGEVGGATWAAYAWAGARGDRRTWSANGAGWTSCREVADELGRLRTGEVGPGWAEPWLVAADPFGAEVRAVFETRLAAVPDGVPTAWCHGDLWLGNVVFAPGGAPTVVDWDNARPDAPAGLDGILVEAWRRLFTRGLSFGEACAALCAARSVPGLVVGGRAWPDWSDAEREGLVSAAFLLHAFNRDLGDLGDAWRAANLAPFLGVPRPRRDRVADAARARLRRLRRA
jgi:hypothetical protein